MVMKKIEVDKDFLDKVLKEVQSQRETLDGMLEQIAHLIEQNVHNVDNAQESLKKQTIGDLMPQLRALQNVQLQFKREPPHREFVTSLILSEIEAILEKYEVTEITLHSNRDVI